MADRRQSRGNSVNCTYIFAAFVLYSASQHSPTSELMAIVFLLSSSFPHSTRFESFEQAIGLVIDCMFCIESFACVSPNMPAYLAHVPGSPESAVGTKTDRARERGRERGGGRQTGRQTDRAM